MKGTKKFTGYEKNRSFADITVSKMKGKKLKADKYNENTFSDLKYFEQDLQALNDTFSVNEDIEKYISNEGDGEQW